MTPTPAVDATERGALSIFVAICAAALLMLSGLVLDGGGRLRAIERADALADEAARAGGQQIDQAALLQGKGIRLDPRAAENAANAYLGANGVTGTPVADDRTITVNVTMTYHTVMLSLFGFGDITVGGHGSARLVPGTTVPDPATSSTTAP
ncbi:TadE/TadG family type IV pilus assembly protein [Streptacidiphilus carbonis]|uniref:TadE/TadG family type IV pilus assembly protein n=1 Tax=Streptacidiphilus carbonis TaxID=105422 RepID=UPI000B08BA21|nr:pilus assembly protein TadG-related protein [Streptacidiphilus carbonis]